MVPRTEVTFPVAQHIKFLATFQEGDELVHIVGLGFVHRLCQHFDGKIIVDRLVLGQFVEAFAKARHEFLGRSGLNLVRPDDRPYAAEAVLARPPDTGHVHVGAGERNIDPEFVVLLGKVCRLVACQIADHNIGRLLTDLEQRGTEFGRVRGQVVIRDKDGAVFIHEMLGSLEQIVAKRVIGGKRHPLLSLDHAVAQQRSSDRADIHRIASLQVEHVATAVFAPQFVRVAACL